MNHGFHLVPAFSLVTLAEKLAERLAERADPFAPETVLVMNFAQRVWLQRFLAEKLGVCANVEFCAPERFLEKLVSRPSENVFARDAFAWKIFLELRRSREAPAGTTRAPSFAADDLPEDGLFRRAAEIGDLFWRYQTFRPEMIRGWMRDEPPPKTAAPDFRREFLRQKNLWRRLDFGGAEPPAEAWLNLLEHAGPIPGVPARLFAFAPSALTRLHAEVLMKLAENAEVFLFCHNLSGDLWTETREEKARLRERARPGRKATRVDAGTLEDDAGNELLTAWGKAARPLAKFLIDADLLDGFSNLDAPPERTSLLRALQREIRDNAAKPTPFVPAKGDASLRILVAPSPLREMEILRDELTARFAADPTLRPRDVVVSFPDPDAYVPFIRAAFENSGIPFSVADQADEEIFPAAKAFFALLRAAQGEFRLGEILALTNAACIRAALGLEEDEAARLRDMLADAGVRWGADKAFRLERVFGEKPVAETMRAKAETFAENNSWAFGLRRLALGYMCGNGEDGEALFRDAGTGVVGVSPARGVTEEAPEAIGKIFRLVETLEKVSAAFAENERRSVSAWRDFLQENLADALIDGGNGEAEIVRDMLAEVCADARTGSFPAAGDPECALATFCAALEKQGAGSGRGSAIGMFRGKVTFCRMQPMRNIPARVVCVCGLSDGAFPRAAVSDGADLISFGAENFPAGTAAWDRTPRDEDCLLFLENILAAQDALLLSYVGRDASDGSAKPPCTPLDKLRHFLLGLVSGGNAAGPDDAPPGAPLFETLHRLHGFSPEYFSDADGNGKLLSFSRAHYAVAKKKRRAPPKRFEAPSLRERAGGRLPVPAEISAKELADFFKSPAKFICGKVLGIAPARRFETPSDDDPPEKFSPLDVARAHRDFAERMLRAAERGNAAAETPAPAADSFREATLRGGGISAFARAEDVRGQLDKEIKDAEALLECLPAKLFRVDDAPAAAVFPVMKFSSPIRIATDFRELFRDEDGRLFLPLCGRKKFDWRAAVETFVAAQMLSATFPQEAFRAVYFAYASATPKIVTDASLRNAGISAQELVELYARRLSDPPPLFENLPIADKLFEETDELYGDDLEKEFFRALRDAWSAEKRDACEIFVFGEDAPELFDERTCGGVFPFVRNLLAAFTVPERPRKKKRG